MWRFSFDSSPIVTGASDADFFWSGEVPCSLTFFPAVSYMIPTFQVKTEDEKKWTKLTSLRNACLLWWYTYSYMTSMKKKRVMIMSKSWWCVLFYMYYALSLSSLATLWVYDIQYMFVTHRTFIIIIILFKYFKMKQRGQWELWSPYATFTVLLLF